MKEDWEISSILEMTRAERKLGYHLIPDYMLDGKN